MIVVDTNIIAYLLVHNDEFTPSADKIFDKEKTWIAPPLWRYEMFNLLNLYRRRSLMSEEDVYSVFFKALETIWTEDLIDLSFWFNTAKISDLTGYDACFVALASEKNLPLVTEDRKILNEFPKVAISMNDFLYKNG